MGSRLVTSPAAEPITLAEAKSHLRVDHASEDVYIGGLIAAARAITENMTGRAWVEQTQEDVLDAWPRTIYGLSGDVVLSRAPVRAVDSITYFDPDGVSRVLSPSDYIVSPGGHSHPGRIRPAPAASWPDIQAGRIDAIAITYKAGVVTAAQVATMPPEIKQAILFVLGHLYLNREDVSVAPTYQVPQAAAALLAPWRLFQF